MIFWITAFCFGAALFAAGLFCFFRRRPGRRAGNVYGIILTFLAGWLLACPYEYYIDVPTSAPGLHLIESLLTALLKTFDVYMGNGYDRYVIEGHAVFSSVYTITAILIDIVFMLFVMGFILSLLDGPSQQLRFLSENHRKAYIFSAANEKSLFIAKSLPAEKHSLIFCVPKLTTDEVKQEILQLGGVYLTRSAGDTLRSRRHCKKDTEVFLFDDTEAANLQALDSIHSLDFSNFRAQIRVYTEISDTPWNIFTEHTKSDKMTVNLIRSEESFAYHQLLTHSVYDNAIQTPHDKEIRILLVGMNRKITELLKALLSLTQMPGYKPTIMVLDGDAGRGTLRRLMPEVCDECHTDGDAEYTLLYKENIDFEGCDVETIIESEFADFTWAFIDIGDDLKNILMARRLSVLKQRMGLPHTFRIFANTAKGNTLTANRIELPPEITTVGHLSDIYDYRFITMSDIEKASKAIHDVRQQEKADRTPGYTIQTWQAYCGNEYNRHSVYARTLSYKFKAELIDRYYNGQYALAASDPVWKKYEHMRWNMYTRTMGYIKPGDALGRKDVSMKELRSAALVHPDLVPFSELPPEEQTKDAMKITEEIAAILKEI